MVIIAALVCVTSSALAQAPAKKPAAPNAVAASYAAMPEADRIAIQTDLIWSGDYNGVASADFGERAVVAVKAFQKRLGHKETGVLNPPERERLADLARRKREAIAWRVVDDAATGSRLGIPSRLVPQQSQAGAGTRWASSRGEVSVETFRAPAGTTLQASYDAQRALANRKVTYGVLRPDFFVVAGLQELQKFYVRAQLKDGIVRGVTIRYDQALEGTMDPIVIAMSSAFAAYANLAPPPRPKVEYASAVVAHPSGYVVTASEVLDGCQTLTLAGVGPAEVAAVDKASGLALLHVFGARNLRGAAVAEAMPAEAKVVGIEDPQAQGGAGAVSSQPVRLAAAAGKTDIDAALPAGFSGAAVTDTRGRLAGLVTSLASAGGRKAEVVSAAVLAQFLSAQKVPLLDAGAETTPEVLRLICVRK